MELQVTVHKRLGAFTLDADFTVSGERIGVFGPSGSGKSTLVSLLAGLDHPDVGAISLDGERLFDSVARINVPPETRRIAIVFQRPCLFPHLSVRANLLYGFRRCAVARRDVGLDELTGVLGLGDLLERGVNNLSGGEKQRVALGRAVLANPRLLIMDEPLSALDDARKLQIIPYLRSVSERFGIPYLFISHSLVEMRLMTDQVVVFDRGRVAGQSGADQLARDRMGTSPVGYINLLRLGRGRPDQGLYAYAWGDEELLISAGTDQPEAIFELSSKDIILFKRHPEAVSARNLLRCRVAGTFPAGNKVGVELDCGGQRLVAEVVARAAADLEIAAGCQLYAVVKASAFRRLG